MKANGRPIQIDVIDWFNEAGDAITPLVAVAEVKEQPERKAAVALSSPPPAAAAAAAAAARVGGPSPRVT